MNLLYRFSAHFFEVSHPRSTDQVHRECPKLAMLRVGTLSLLHVQPALARRIPHG